MSGDSTLAEINATRRRILQMIAAGGAFTALGGYSQAARNVAGNTAVAGYGFDPNLFDPTVPWEKSLAGEQLSVLRILGDLILPADDRSPKASDLDIAGFVDEWVSAPYPEQRRDRKTLLEGLSHLDRQAETYGVKGFVALEAQQQASLFDGLAAAVKQGSADANIAHFFERLVYLFVGGFYTTREGMADIGYVGNTPMVRFDGPPAEVRQRLGI